MRQADRTQPSPGPRPVPAVTALGAATALLLAGCTGGQEGTGGDAASIASGSDDAGMGHVHGLGQDRVSGDVLVATHTGLFRLRDGAEPQRVADRRQDTMGFTVDGDRLLGSGHPDSREGLPSHLGLIESSDAGETWTAVSLQGDADFHTLTVSGVEVVGWDSLSGTVLVSSNGGRSWSPGAGLDSVADLEHLADGAGLLATTADGLLVSPDSGRTFEAFDPAPPTTLVQVESAGQTATGVDVEGGVWDLTGDAWVARGSIGAPPAAFAASDDGTLLAATATEALRLDGGTWTVLADVAGTP